MISEERREAVVIALMSEISKIDLIVLLTIGMRSQRLIDSFTRYEQGPGVITSMKRMLVLTMPAGVSLDTTMMCCAVWID